MRHAFRSMGCDVVVDGASAAAALKIRDLFDRYDATFSRFRPESELNRLNERRGGRMSELFTEVLGVAVWASAETAGLVDPLVGRALLAAGYDRDFAAGLDSDEPARPMRTCTYGHEYLCVRGRVLLLRDGAILDLNGVVKSLAVDRAAALLDGDGFVSAGGDIATRGPVDVALTGTAVRVTGGLATSGTTRRRWLRAGRTQHHLIDPASGAPADSPWHEVTVCGATCVAADIAAKAAFLLGDDGPGWLDARGLPGRFVGDRVVANAHWEAACT